MLFKHALPNKFYQMKLWTVIPQLNLPATSWQGLLTGLKFEYFVNTMFLWFKIKQNSENKDKMNNY